MQHVREERHRKLPLDGRGNISEAHNMTRMVEAVAFYKCPHCKKSSTARVKAKVRLMLTLHRDMTETEAYELEDVEITPSEGCE